MGRREGVGGSNNTAMLSGRDYLGRGVRLARVNKASRVDLDLTVEEGGGGVGCGGLLVTAHRSGWL